MVALFIIYAEIIGKNCNNHAHAISNLINEMDTGPLSPLTQESESENEDDDVQSGKIKKPRGGPGRLGGKGYNLQSELDWNDRTYESVLVSSQKQTINTN